MKKSPLIIAVISLITLNSYSAVLVGYNTISATSITPINIETEINGLDLSRGNGISEATGASFNSNSWNSTSQPEASINNEYLEFGLVINSGFQVANLSAEFFGDRSNTGPNSIEVFFSTDGFLTETSVLNDIDVGISGSTQNTIPIISNLTGTIEFRIYGYGATSTSGTFDLEPLRIDNTYGLTLNGDISAIPEPSSTTLLISIGITLTCRRKRQ